jgi:transmembrane sensor
MKSFREILTQRYLDKTITTEELEILTDMLTQDGLTEEDQLFTAMEIELRKRKTFTQEDIDHVANNLFYEREEEKQPVTVPMYRSGKFVWWSAAATIVLVLNVGLYWQLFKDNDTPLAPNELAPEILISVKGPEFVIMPDSSTAILNAGSELSYRKSFGQGLREVFLTGEAFFDIKHDPAHKFVVRSGNVSTTVLGTAFNVRQLPSKVVVTVTRGKVAVKDEAQEFGTITPNEQFTVDTENHVCTRSNAKEGLATEWVSNFMIINNENLEHAVEQIETRFKVKITVENQALLKCRTTIGLLRDPKLEEVLTVLSTLANATWTMKDGGVTIHGGACN